MQLNNVVFNTDKELAHIWEAIGMCSIDAMDFIHAVYIFLSRIWKTRQQVTHQVEKADRVIKANLYCKKMASYRSVLTSTFKFRSR